MTTNQRPRVTRDWTAYMDRVYQLGKSGQDVSNLHSHVGVPEARKILRLIDNPSPSSLAELNFMAIQAGAAVETDDAATVIRRMKKVADDTIRLFG